MNDSYGHPAGDQVLKTFSSTVISNIRTNDILGRIGGEEFAILFPETSAENASIVCDKIRQKVAETTIFLASNQKLQITVSIGVSACDQEDLEIETIIQRADWRLYRAKTGGRNQVVFRE